MADLVALTAYTGNEFAMFTRKGKRLTIRGDKVSVNILPEDARILAKQGYRWSGHTHPGNNPAIAFPSQGDRNVLSAMGQNKSAIYNSTGRMFVFGIEEEFDDGFKNL